ncbi:unnamed protein product [Rodentolepis nana]|uniref:AMPK1_CBM domain-containing protein n=1 Tax=Rodentolepis nana TaxID=102285 RepID=A0A0R3TUI2_RODNA|nr:unnamed protein product [Rodentolepis nana]
MSLLNILEASRHKSSKVTSPISKSQNEGLTEASLEMETETSSGQPITQPSAPSPNFPTSATLPRQTLLEIDGTWERIWIPQYIVVGLHNGGLVVFNVNFNCWREKILTGGGFKEQKPKLSLQKPITPAVAEEVAEERKEMGPGSNSPTPPTNTEEGGSNDSTASVEAAEQAEIKSSEVDGDKSEEDEAVPDVSNSEKSPSP